MPRTMNIATRSLALALLLIACSACGPGVVTGDESLGAGESGWSGTSSEVGEAWDEIRCIEMLPGLTSCMGRPHGSSDSWVFVVSECQLYSEIDNGTMSIVEGWSPDTCAPGKSPSGMMPMHVCVWADVSASSACFAGGDGWYTQVMPSCDVAPGQSPAWPKWQCDGSAGYVGGHPWDAIYCSDNASTACIAVDDADAMLAWPTCWVDQYQDVSAPTC